MAEEIVKVISIDTRKSERSIKDLKNDIKALKKELESTTIGSKEFDLKLNQLGKLQKEYKAINEEIVSSSKPVQRQMFELARFGENLAKSYSAINAAMGLLSDGNEDLQKALLKTSQMIQLIQGLSGFAPMLRDIPKVIDKFKGLFKWIDPINSRINNMASKIAGISMNKLNALNAANASGGSATASSGGGTTNISTDIASAQETVKRGIMPVSQALEELKGKISDLHTEYDKAKKAQLEADEVLKQHQSRYAGYAEDMEKLGELIRHKSDLELKWTRTVGPEADKIQKEINDTLEEMTEIWGRRRDQFESMAEFQEAAQQAGRETRKLKGDLETATAQVKTYQKALSNTRWASIFINALKAVKIALASVGIGLIIAGISWLISWIPKLWQKLDIFNQKQKQLNKTIAEGTASISAKSLVAFKELAKRYRELGDSAEAKKKFLVDFKKEIEETGLAIKDVNDADNAFVNNTDAYIKAIKDRAKAQAIENEAVRLYQEYLEERAKKENSKKGRQRAKDKQLAQDLVGAGIMTQGEADMVGETTKLGKQLQKMETEVEATLDHLFEEMFDLEKKSGEYFAEVAEDGGNTVKDSTEDELKLLEQYYKEALRLFMDEEQRELDEIEEKYAERIQLAKDHKQYLTEIEEAKQKEINDIVEKYAAERKQKAKEDLEKEFQDLQDKINELRAYAEYEATVRDKTKGGTDNWTYFNGGYSKYKTNKNVKDDYQNTLDNNNWEFDHLKARIDAENKLLEQQLAIKEIGAEREMEIRQQIANNDKELGEAELERAKKNKEAKQRMLEDYVTVVTNSFESASQLIGGFADLTGAILDKQMKEDEAAGDAQYTRAKKTFEWYKGFQIAQAIINTFSSAISAYNSAAATPVVGPYLAPIAAAGAIASGIANVMTIKQQQFEGGSSSSISSASVEPPAALSTPPIEYTRNLLGNKETDEINKPVRVYVLESDITEAQNKVKVTEENASF